MKYKSTRDSSILVSFEDAVLRGLSQDGGLFIPENIPSLSLDKLDKLSFIDLAFKIFRLFISDIEINSLDLEKLIKKSYTDSFKHPLVAPVVSLSSDISVLELFHGPTLAFKDVALQFLGNVFEHFLVKRGTSTMTVLGATSGDTGSAAISGLAGKQNINVFILHPRGKTSPIQEAQMTTNLDKNVYNVSVEGTFDDCQFIVKSLFKEEEFRKTYNLGAVNSINWARILAQITYYFYSYFQVTSKIGTSKKINYAVPTGNFGDILAGFYAKKMGLPINKLIICSNSNDILPRFFENGVYERKSVQESLSPAMDIQISSNFERFLFYLANESLSEPNDSTASKMVNNWMKQLETEKMFKLGSPELLNLAQSYFEAFRVSDVEILETIKSCHFGKFENKMTVDPHTAVGICALEKYRSYHANDTSIHTICLSTAHPAKFLSAVMTALDKESISKFSKEFGELERALLSKSSDQLKNIPFKIPEEFIGLLDKPRRCLHSKADAQDIKNLIISTLKQ